MAAYKKLWGAYTRQVLEWRLGDGPVSAAPRENAEAASRAARRILRLGRNSGRERCVLLGAGQGILAGLLARNLPPEGEVLVLECDPHAARAALPFLPSSTVTLVDASPWALLLWAYAAGLNPENCVTAWTLPKETQPGGRKLDMWRRLFSGARRENSPTADADIPPLSVGCILHPDEPRLEEFFAHIPPWVRQVCVVWDGTIPQRPPPCPAAVKFLARPLRGDFAAQRNVMLDMCDGRWCLYLDADERLEPAAWEALPRLMACAGVDGFLFPRLTFEGDVRHGRMGYGLWPDLQLRLFRLREGEERPSFTGTVHERVRGLRENLALAPGFPLLHYSHVLKDRAALLRRLAVFDAAGTAAHTLSRAYPALPVELLRETERDFGLDHILRLPRLDAA